jgi:hypothetical protein
LGWLICWLYWDINITTGVRTFGSTIHSPVFGPTPPNAPTTDQHWYNTTIDDMFVWNGARWAKKIRLFAANMTNNSTFISMSINSPLFTGTQIGNTTINRAGFLIYDDTGAHPIKKFDDTFFTTEDTVLTGISSTAQVKFGSILLQGIANASLAAYSVVRFSDYNLISQATSYLVDNGAYGIIEVDAVTGDNINIIMEGIVTNPAWNWASVSINTPLYVDTVGQLTAIPPATPIIIATVVGLQSILLRPSSLFVNNRNDPASSTNMGAVFLSHDPDSIQNPIAVSVNDVNYLSTVAHLSDTISHLTPTQHTLITEIVTPGNTATLQVGTITAAAHKSSVLTLVDAGGVNWDMNLGVFASITLTSAVTFHAPTNLPVGTLITLVIIQDITGLHNITFDPIFKWANSTGPTIGLTSPLARSILTFISDGTALFEVSRSLNIL